MASASLFDTERARAHVGKDLVLGPHRGTPAHTHHPSSFTHSPSPPSPPGLVRIVGILDRVRVVCNPPLPPPARPLHSPNSIIPPPPPPPLSGTTYRSTRRRRQPFLQVTLHRARTRTRALPPACHTLCRSAIINIDPAVVGVSGPPPSRDQLLQMLGLAHQLIGSSAALQLLPTTLHGVRALDYATSVFMYTMEGPYPLYSCITNPLNVNGVRSVESLHQQLPYAPPPPLLNNTRAVPPHPSPAPAATSSCSPLPCVPCPRTASTGSKARCTAALIPQRARCCAPNTTPTPPLSSSAQSSRSPPPPPSASATKLRVHSPRASKSCGSTARARA